MATPHGTAAAPSRRGTIAIAVVGTVLVLACATLSAVQILVLNPMAAVPGVSLDQIYQDLAARDESLGVPVVLLEMGFGVLLAVVLLVLTVRFRDLTSRSVAAGYLILLTLATPAYFWAGFGAGMGLADTYEISGGDYSPWAWPIYLCSAVALTALVVLILVGGLREVRQIPPAATVSSGLTET